MCGRYVSATPVEELAAYFGAEPDENLAEAALPRYNVPPTEQVLGVLIDPRRPGEEPGAEPVRRIAAFRWGLVPSFAKDPAEGNRAFNARAETVATRPAFRAAFRSRRLIVPASAFYEWEKAGGRRLPFAFARADGAPLAFAGLWELWRHPESRQWLRSCTIITTPAGPDVAPVHDRQPAVLDPASFAVWLDPAEEDRSELESLLVPSPAGTLVAHRVGRAVGDVANDGPQLLAPRSTDEAGSERLAVAAGGAAPHPPAGEVARRASQLSLFRPDEDRGSAHN